MTKEQIEDNKTTTLKTGDSVKMVNCAEAFEYPDKIWICRTDSFKYPYGNNGEVVFLNEKAGCFLVEFLNKVK